jgi:hypothetical protein
LVTGVPDDDDACREPLLHPRIHGGSISSGAPVPSLRQHARRRGRPVARGPALRRGRRRR